MPNPLTLTAGIAGNRVELIAEVSSNHGGDLELAKAFIWQCAEAGANWVKFQSYQVRTLRQGDPQRDWLAQAELADDAHYILKAECEKAGTKFLTTVFHHSRVPFLASLGLEAIKVGSGEAREPILAAAVNRQRAWARVFVSCGVTGARSAIGWSRADALHCVSRYPHPSACAVVDYGRRFVGYSDHSIGLEGCQLACIRGAKIIEKHVGLPAQKRPRKPWEATMAELKELRQFADDDPSTYIGRWQHGE